MAQVFPGDDLTATVTVTEVREGEVDLEVVTRNQNGIEVFKGSASARVDA